MIWVKVSGLLHQSATALPVAGIGKQKTHVPDGESIHRIEFDGPLRGAPKGLRLPPEKQDRCQGMMREEIRRRGVNRAPPSGYASSYPIRPKPYTTLLLL